MGTDYLIKYAPGEKSKNPQDVKNRVDEELVKINLSVSTWMSDSKISSFNKLEDESWYLLDPIFSEIFLISQDIYRKSEGYFDPSIGPLVNIWGFGPYGEREIPTKAKIKETLKYTGLHKIKSRGKSHQQLAKNKINIANAFQIYKPHPKFYLDFSAVAKGYAVDHIAKVLEREFAIKDYMVEIGGEIRTRSLGDRTWNLAVEKPSMGQDSIQRIISVKTKSIATSGNYRNFFIEEDGETQIMYGHTINPKTGKSTQNDVLSASVMHDSCAYADAWATAFMAMGSKKAIELANKYGIPAYFVVKDNANLKELESKTWVSKVIQ